MKKVLIIGGYGNFGSFIARALAQDKTMDVVIAGRSGEKAQELAKKLGVRSAVLDIEMDMDEKIAAIKPDIIIHTSGPFQSQDYDVARACIRHRCHYIDLADGREFVTHIMQLDAAAKEVDVLVVSGASSVPCLTSAIVDAYKGEFYKLENVEYAIATAQKTNRGLATTKAVLGYAGKPFTTLMNSQRRKIYGWQNLHWHKFEGLGWRALGNCDIPDLDLFPVRYPTLRTVRFYAGLELPFVHLGLWGLSGLVRMGLIKNLASWAEPMLAASRWFDGMGSDKSAFFMAMTGARTDDTAGKTTFNLVALNGDGPYIPCMPAILLARKLAQGEMMERGAMPCMGLVTLGEYLEELGHYAIRWSAEKS